MFHVQVLVSSIKSFMSHATVYFSLLVQGIAPHISPFTEMRDVGGLLTNAGFNMTTLVSTSIHTLVYPHTG